MGRFEGKVAIVTGAAKGIGAAYAQALARQGAAVVVVDRNEEDKEVADGIGGTFVRTDVSDPDAVQAMAAHAVERFGGIDYLVNNAAICGSMKFDFLMSVDVNAIAPGVIDTAATHRIAPETWVQDKVKELAINRVGTPGDLVGMCLFLLSDEASWITGQIFNVDGGQVFRS